MKSKHTFLVLAFVSGLLGTFIADARPGYANTAIFLGFACVVFLIIAVGYLVTD